jgi:hypothetical protein
MGANTTVYVKVVKEVVGWVEVSAINLGEAMRTARAENNDVVRVIHAQYEEPYSET